MQYITHIAIHNPRAQWTSIKLAATSATIFCYSFHANLPGVIQAVSTLQCSLKKTFCAVVSRFSGLRLSGLLLSSVLFLLHGWQQKWSNHIIEMILLSGPSQSSGPFCSDGLSPHDRDINVFLTNF